MAVRVDAPERAAADTPPALRSSNWYERLRPSMRPGHEVVLMEGGGQMFPALEAAIDAARSEVLLETYIFEDDASGRRIAGALARAGRRGVSVRLVVDGFGCGTPSGEVARLLDGSGVAVEVFRPEPRFFSFSRRRLRRMHRKLAVIDGEVAFVGGINVLDDLYDPNHGTLAHPRLDFAVRVRGPLVATVHLAMVRLWLELRVVNQPLRAVRDPMPTVRAGPVVSVVSPAGNLRAMLVLRDNLRFRRTIEQHYLRALGRARREVLIANAYFLPGLKFRRALLSAVRRGVKVRLLLQGLPEYRLQHYAAQALYEELLAGGVEIVEYRKSFLHAKVAVIDDWATVGSSNIDPFSLLLAREANVVVSDAGFAASLRARLLAAIDDGGLPIVAQHLARRSWFVRLLQNVAFGMLRLGVALSGVSGRY